MKKLKLLLIPLLTILFLVGCIKEKDTKTTGDTMKIMLSTDTSNNYVWTYTIMDSNVIDIKDEQFLTKADDETLDGETQVFIFKSFSTGEVEILLNYINQETGESKYDITYIINVDENKNITVSSKSGKYDKKIPTPIIYSEANTDTE